MRLARLARNGDFGALREYGQRYGGNPDAAMRGAIADAFGFSTLNEDGWWERSRGTAYYSNTNIAAGRIHWDHGKLSWTSSLALDAQNGENPTSSPSNEFNLFNATANQLSIWGIGTAIFSKPTQTKIYWTQSMDKASKSRN